MTVLRNLAVTTALAAAALATPASAQFYFQSHDMSGPPIRGDEPGLPTLPGATDEEIRANLVWNLRSALNVAALQCQFEPTLLTVENYNIALANHKDEFKKSFDTLVKYFNRTAKGVKPGQTAMDRYGTRTYSAFHDGRRAIWLLPDRRAGRDGCGVRPARKPVQGRRRRHEFDAQCAGAVGRGTFLALYPDRHAQRAATARRSVLEQARAVAGPQMRAVYHDVPLGPDQRSPKALCAWSVSRHFGRASTRSIAAR